MPFEVHFGCWGWPWTSCWRPLEMPRAWPGSRSGPGTARMGWMALPSGREHCFTGIQGTAKVGSDLELLGPTINLTTALFKELSFQNCLT